MRNNFLTHRKDGFKRAPLWKIIVILLLVVAMPLFFAYYRSIMLQGAINASTPQPAQQTATPH